RNVLDSVKKCLDDFNRQGFNAGDIKAIGISNQRETFLTWNKAGQPLYPAIVWQCKRSLAVCEELKTRGLAQTIQEKTGLIIDPYFSATKLTWLFQQDKKVRENIENGTAYFGTIDTWLLYKLTDGKEYATDHTNASRTLFFNLHTLNWDAELIKAYGLTGIRLPVIKPSAAHYGETDIGGLLPGLVPVTALIGDSHAAAFGEGCFEPGSAKATLGTGCSVMMNIGDKPAASANGMVTTVCWSMEGRVDYALEGVIVSCGATIEWLKNELNLFTDVRETEQMAHAVADSNGVFIIPAFSGLGAPFWDMGRKAAITGLTFSANKNHIVRAALESIPYQLKAVLNAMEKDAGLPLRELNVNGGISANRFVTRLLADLIGKKVMTRQMPDVSALGAAYMAGLKAGLYTGLPQLSSFTHEKTTITPAYNNNNEKQFSQWLLVVKENS
ncbi:MAG TPA: FGGY family carbohydrate kinase, partial [Chitinophagaceae bacterium]